MGKVIRYEEKYDPNHSQECICHRSPMCRGLEESPEGSYVDYEEYEKLEQRVAELEFQHQLLTKRIEPLLDMQEDGEHYARCHLADDIYEAFIEGSSVDALNKFAIEQQNKGVEDYKKSDEFCRLLDSHFNSGKVYGHNEYYEHLRKEQE